MAKPKLKWRGRPAAADFSAAAAYLSLVLPDGAVKKVVARFRRATTTKAKAKDLERATGLELLPLDDPEVVAEIKRLRRGRALSPILLIRGNLEAGRPLEIADGYHRICASYHIDLNAEIPCRVVDLT